MDSELKVLLNKVLKQLDAKEANNLVRLTAVQVDTEIAKLRKRFRTTAWSLSIVTSICVLLLLVVLDGSLINQGLADSIVIVVASGLLGSSIAALISVLSRYANGFELSDGSQHPKSDKPIERFNAQMVPFFALRPFLGLSVSLLIYLAITTEILNLNASYEGLMLYCTIGSFFAKTLIERVKESVKSFKL